ncbi:MAG: hypothetical protein ACRDDY_13230 [Clostridium sp.]
MNLTVQQKITSAKNKIQVAISAEDKAMYLEAVSELKSLGWYIR